MIAFARDKELTAQDLSSGFTPRPVPSNWGAPDGYFHWPGRLNGVAVDALVDTDATRKTLPQVLAERAALRAEGRSQPNTAGRVAQAYPSRADAQFAGGVRAERLRVPVLASPLLGMDRLPKMRSSQQGRVMSVEP